MSVYNDLENNISKLESLITSSDFDITKYFVSDDEVVKRILQIKNPNITESQIVLMVNGVGKFKEDVDNRLKKVDDNKALTDDQKKTLKDHIVKETKDIIGSSIHAINPILEKIYPINKEALLNESKRMKSEVMSSVSKIVKESKNIPKSLANASLLAISGISGASILIATIPVPNLPAAISLLSSIIETYVAIIDKLKSVVSSLYPLKNIRYVTNDDNFYRVAVTMNSFLKILIGLFNPIILLERQIKTILEFLTSLFSRDNMEDNIKTVTKRLRKLDYLPRNNFSRVGEDDEEEVKRILEQYDVIDRDSRTRAVRFKNNLESQLKSQLDTLTKTVEESVNIPDPSEVQLDINDQYVYDVRLPDGTNLYGLTKDELEDLEEFYNLRINNNV